MNWCKSLHILFILHYLYLSVFFIIGGSSKCPIRNNNDSRNWTETFKEIGAIVSTRRYNNSNTKYYVMTPSSSPRFVNPNGKPYDWTSLECHGKPILFSCHGWLSDGNQTWAHDLLSTFVKEYQGCGVSSDYSGATKNYNYFAAACETNNIAEGLADYIYNNICKAINCSRNLHIFGHSIGAHTCGVTGYLLKQKGIVVKRVITADAAGPAYNIANISDSSIHLSRDSGATVINLKTTCILGDSKPEWVHQQQIIGSCSCNQNQCKPLDTGCNHSLGIYMIRTTMQSTFHDIKLKMINKNVTYSCVLPKYVEPEVTDSLGWKSRGTRGIFKTGKLDHCLDLSESLQRTSNKYLLHKKINYLRLA